MTSTPDILAPYLVHFTTKPNAIESVQIYEKCLNDIHTDFTERLAMIRNRLDDVRAHVQSASSFFLLLLCDFKFNLISI